MVSRWHQKRNALVFSTRAGVTESFVEIHFILRRLLTICLQAMQLLDFKAQTEDRLA
jgi:hypothetical protein